MCPGSRHQPCLKVFDCRCACDGHKSYRTFPSGSHFNFQVSVWGLTKTFLVMSLLSFCKKYQCNSKSKPTYFMIDTIKKAKYSMNLTHYSVASRFLSISTANVEVDFDSDCSTVTKQDSRCRHTYVYNVHKVSLLSTTLQAVYSKDTSIEMRQRAFFRRFTGRINYF